MENTMRTGIFVRKDVKAGNSTFSIIAMQSAGVISCIVITESGQVANAKPFTSHIEKMVKELLRIPAKWELA